MHSIRPLGTVRSDRMRLPCLVQGTFFLRFVPLDCHIFGFWSSFQFRKVWSKCRMYSMLPSLRQLDKVLCYRNDLVVGDQHIWRHQTSVLDCYMHGFDSVLPFHMASNRNCMDSICPSCHFLLYSIPTLLQVRRFRTTVYRSSSLP